jgi:hypothetical protein
VLEKNFHKITFQYVPLKEDVGAALSFHLTKREKWNIYESLDHDYNKSCFNQFLKYIDAPQNATRKAAIAGTH